MTFNVVGDIYSKDEILNFIQDRFTVDCQWTSGNCYYFAVILKERFKMLDIYYDPINGHFIAGDGKTFFDYIGENTPQKFVLFSDLAKSDPEWYFRIKHDCID